MARKTKKERRAEAGKKGKKKAGLTIGDLSKVQSSFFVGAGPQHLKVIEVEQDEGDKGPYLKWTFEVTKGKYVGRKPKPYYTSLADDSLWNIKKVLEAIGYEIPEGEFDLDPSDLIGEECVGIIDHEVYNGKRQSVIIDFGDESEDEDEGEEPDEEEEEDEDEKPARGKKGGKDKAGKKSGKKKKDEEEEDEDETEEEEESDEPSEEAINEMTEEELEDFCTDNELEVDLDDYRVISKKRKAVVKAAKKAKLI